MRTRFLNLLLFAVPGALVAQPGTPPPGRPYLFVLDLQGTALDEFPSSVKALNGVMTTVDKNGQRMLMASSPSELLITLPQLLPSVFTVEVDLVPKACCNPDDFMVEGTPTRNRGAASAELTWHPERISAVGGGGEMYQSAVPADLAAVAPGNLTHLVIEINGPTIKLWTNGRRLYTLDKQFVRGRVLRVWLGGESATNPMYLAGLRVGTGPAAPGVIAASGGQPSALSQLSNPLPTVNPAQQQSVSQSQGLTGGPTPTFVANVSVTQGSSGPVVRWLAVAAPATYTVKRWKINDQTCCNNGSGNLPGPPWQDVQPPLAGTYVYEVTVTTNGGTATGQAQFVNFKQGGQIANTGLAPAPSSGPRTVTATSTTPTINPPPGAASGSVASGFTVTVTMGPQAPVVSWPLVPNATGYTVARSKSDDANCCNTSSGRTWGARSPWQDGPLPMPGTYVYTVLANTTFGQVQGQAQYTLAAPVTGVVATGTTTGTITPMPAPVTAVPATATTTGTITPMPAPAPTPIAPSSTATGGQILTPTRPSGTTSTNTGAAPVNLQADPTPVTVTLYWGNPWASSLLNPTGGFEVRRSIRGGGAWTLLTPTQIQGPFTDTPPDRTQTYTYEVTAIDPNGARGASTVDVTLKPPVDPTWFSARAIGPDEVELTWMAGLPDVKDYFLTGPGTGNGMMVTPTLTGGAHHWLYTLKGIPPGTHTWTVASDYQPGGILTPQSQWPKATLTMAASGKYEISVESVLSGGMAVDDIFNGDGQGNEIFVTALVRTKDQAGNVVSETSHRTATYGDVSNWPTRVRAGSGKPSGGIFSGDLMVPIWDQPQPGATGFSRFVLWSGTLTAGSSAVEIAPAVWEWDGIWRPRPYDDLLRQVGYTLLDLNARTAYGEISNVMNSSEEDFGAASTNPFIGFHIVTPEDRPIGIAKKRDPLDDGAKWYPFGIRIDQSVAEAALGGSYGPPGLIQIVVVDHKILSHDTFTHPDLGAGRYTLNIRVTRLP